MEVAAGYVLRAACCGLRAALSRLEAGYNARNRRWRRAAGEFGGAAEGVQAGVLEGQGAV